MGEALSSESKESLTFDEAYTRYFRLVAHYATRKGAEGKGEDAAQEAFLRMWKHGQEFSHEEAPRWLLTVVRRIIIDDYRKRTVPQVPLEEGDVGALSADLEMVELRSLIEQGLGFMNDAQRSTVELAYGQDCPYQEVADKTGVQVGTVKSRVSYGVRAARLGFEELGITADVVNY